MLPVKTEMPQRLSRLCSGVRRAFFCRMKTGIKSELLPNVKVETDADHYMCQQKTSSGENMMHAFFILLGVKATQLTNFYLISTVLMTLLNQYYNEPDDAKYEVNLLEIYVDMTV